MSNLPLISSWCFGLGAAMLVNIETDAPAYLVLMVYFGPILTYWHCQIANQLEGS